MTKGLRTIGCVFATLYHRFFDDHCPSRAASLAYTTLLSLVPLMMVGFFILSWVPMFKGVAPQIQKFIVSNFVADSATVISQYLNDFLGHLRDLSITNIGFLGIVSILLIYNMVGAFNEIWHVRMETHFAIAFGIYLLVLLFTPLLFALLIVMISYFASTPFVGSTAAVSFIKKPLFKVLPYLCEFIVFSFFNYVLPSTRVRLIYALIAGAMTTILFEFAKLGFTFYLNYVPTYRLIYGALATIPIFLIWIYVVWLIILFCALCCNLMSKGLPKRTK